MISNKNLKNYQVLACQQGFKTEKIGGKIIQRDDAFALDLKPGDWPLDARYDGSKWDKKLENWIFEYQDLKFYLKQGKSHHIGIFPEQTSNWDWMRNIIAQKPQEMIILNLFAHTGGASMAAAKEGCAEIVHLDALRSANEWAKENAKLNQLEDQKIRYIQDDSLKFIQREKRRQRQYHGIIMDPPSFGRGPKNELWRLEDELDQLIDQSLDLLKDRGEFLIINTYSKKISKRELKKRFALQAEKHQLGGAFESYDLVLPIRDSQQALPAGQTLRWVKHERNL